MEPDEPFWMVWSDRGNPTIKWNDLEKAEAEAERLSQKHIGTKFYIAYLHAYFLSEAKTTKYNL